MARSLRSISREIHGQQAEARRVLHGAVIGRPVTLDPEAIGDCLSDAGNKQVRYRQLGQQAVVYTFRNDLRTQIGKTYFNPTHVQQAIAQAPHTAREPLLVSRGELEVIPRQTTESEHQPVFWLTAFTLRAAKVTKKGTRVNMRAEEQAIADSLFTTDNNLTGQPVAWLGALAAPSIDVAEEALESLEGVIAARLAARPVELIPASR